MTEQFMNIGATWAVDFKALNPKVLFDAELPNRCAEWAWKWFCAEMSDSYEVTIKEQTAICADIRAKYGNIQLPMKLATRDGRE